MQFGRNKAMIRGNKTEIQAEAGVVPSSSLVKLNQV